MILPAVIPRIVEMIPQVLPYDAHNEKLLANAHPLDWVNPEPASRYNLVVLGAGTAGLVSAAGAAGLGAKVALVEKHLLGGDCLNVGCVPSKALIRSARAFADVRDAGDFGVAVEPGARVDFARVMERMRRLRAQISPNDSAGRLRSLGVDVFLGAGRFTGPDTIDVDGKSLRFKKAVIATGARPSSPAIPGAVEAGYLTNETVFSLTELPARLAVIGAGPVGCELSQAFARFGSTVFLIPGRHQILGREDRDAAARIEKSLVRDGVRLLAGCRVKEVRNGAGAKRLILDGAGTTEELEVDQILFGVGRTPNVEHLGLGEAGVAFDLREGVKVDDGLRTTNRNIFAAGDVCFPFKFTHTADALARIVIQNALFRGRAKASDLVIPWCTYTDPELAHVGIDEAQAREKGMAVRTLVVEFSEVDRAVLDGEPEGLLKIHCAGRSDRILGATLVARHAGEMISEITLAMVCGQGLKSLSKTIHPYPTQAEVFRKAGDAFNRTRLTPLVKSLLARWLSWTR